MSVSPSGQCSTVQVNDDGSAVVASCATIINQTGGGGIADGDKGDITVSGTGTVWTVDNDAITFAKMQNVEEACLLGREAGVGTGDPKVIKLDTQFVWTTIGSKPALSVSIPSDATKVSTSTLVSTGSGLTGGGSLSGNLTLSADFGSGAGKVCEGNDARLSDARTPTSHTHGNITNGGEIGSTAGLVVKTGSAGILTTLALGTAGQVLAVNGGATDIEWVTGGGGGSTVTLDVQTFAASGTWTKPANAQVVILEGTGGGGGGGNGTTGAAGVGGCAGLAYQVTVEAAALGATESVTIGAGGSATNDGGDSIVKGWTWSGGRGAQTATKSLVGITATSGFGAGGSAAAGRHGGWGAGGGGSGATTGNAQAGGLARSFAMGATVAASGGGAAGATGSAGNSGTAASVTVDGFGEGGGGGGRNTAGAGGDGGAGIRGSGGGGGGQGTTAGSTGGTGGDGFIRVITICWS